MDYGEMYSEVDIKRLQELMIDYYMFIDDINYENVLRQIDGYFTENKMYNPQRKLDKLRGILFESLIDNLVKNRYEHNFECGCVVFINGTKIVSIYESKCRMTIDVAGFDNVNKGEFYECKVTPNSLDEKSYLYLDKLERSLRAVNDVTYVVGCVSAGTLPFLDAKKRTIEDELGITNANISLIGINEIVSLERYPSIFNIAI